MSHREEIGILRGMLININIMIGASLFVNPIPLSKLVGPWGFVSYLLCALLFLPIILTIAELASEHPVSGGLHVYSKEYLHPFAGFVSGWSYFIGKLTSCAFLTDTFVKFFYVRIDAMQSYPRILFDCLFIALLIGANCAGVRIGGKIQYLFTALKLIPILFVVTVGLSFFNGSFFDSPELLSNLGSTLPIVAFSFSGFEVTCLIAHLIKDSKRNARKVIVGSFCAGVALYTLFQLCIYGALGGLLSTSTEPVLTFGHTLFAASPWIGALFNSFVFCAIVGSSFGILTSNCWNLHRLGAEGLLPFSKALTTVNRNAVPWVSLIIEGALICAILAISTQQIALQNMSIFCVVISYLLSVVAAVAAIRTGSALRIYSWIPYAAIMSCCVILTFCLQRLASSGLSTAFALLFGMGIVGTLLYADYRAAR